MKSNAHTTPWDAARLAKLVELFNAGLSAAKIAKVLGFTTRNGVIGKLSRLRARQVIGPSKNICARPRVPRPADPVRAPRDYVRREAPAKHPKPTGERAAVLMDAALGGCRWIEQDFTHGDGAGARMCNEVATGGVYCPHHRALAYQPETPSERRRRKALAERAAVYYQRR